MIINAAQHTGGRHGAAPDFNPVVSEYSLGYGSGVSPRAAALPPTQRRAAIVAATTALIRERAAVPPTKAIAEAAGVAEGTVFRAFETKDELIAEVISAAFCPAPLLRELQSVDGTLPLRERLVDVVSILQQRLVTVFDLMLGLRMTAPPMDRASDHPACTPQTGHVRTDGTAVPHPAGRAHHRSLSGRGRVAEAVIALVEADADLLACSPKELVRYLRLLTFSGSHRHIADGPLLKPETIVDVVLTGVLRRSPATAGRPTGTRGLRRTSPARRKAAP